MLRSSLKSSRPVFKAIGNSAPARTSFNATAPIRTSRIHTSLSKRPVPSISRIAAATLRYATSGSSFDKTDAEAEKKIGAQPLEAHPDQVSAESSVRHLFEGNEAKVGNQDNPDANMGGGMKNDLKTIAETFALTEVPRESYYLGAAGIIPYAVTSLSTVYLTYDIGHAHANMGQGYLISPETAYQLLHLIEPIQIGYGAVIISFLGAIHWGLEYAGYGGYHSYRRYAIGVIAPAVAWPTMLMPIETALITQFLAFVFLYFTDARATVRGWCPPWYSAYRFVLTFFVGASIVISLIGRGQIVKVHPDKDGKLSFGSFGGPADAMQKLRDSQWENLEKEEVERRKRLVEEDEAAEESEGEDEGGDESSEESGDENEDEKKDDDKDDGKKDEKNE